MSGAAFVAAAVVGVSAAAAVTATTIAIAGCVVTGVGDAIAGSIEAQNDVDT